MIHVFVPKHACNLHYHNLLLSEHFEYLSEQNKNIKIILTILTYLQFYFHFSRFNLIGKSYTQQIFIMFNLQEFRRNRIIYLGDQLTNDKLKKKTNNVA